MGVQEAGIMKIAHVPDGAATSSSNTQLDGPLGTLTTGAHQLDLNVGDTAFVV